MAGEKEQENPYSGALERIEEELEELRKQENQLALRKARLIESFEALLPLVLPEETQADINSLTLADSIRLVVKCAARPLHIREIRMRLDEMGFKTMKFRNPMASVHTAVKRMIDSKELAYIKDPHDGAKMIERGPFLKAAVFLERDISASSHKNNKGAVPQMTSEKRQEDFQPIHIKGEPLSATILRERR